MTSEVNQFNDMQYPVCVTEPYVIQSHETEDYPDVELAEEPMHDEVTEVEESNGWLRRNYFKLALGAAAVSTAITLINDPFEETKDQVLDAAPWVAGGVIASEGLFVLGAGMMLVSIGEKIGNPLTIKKRTSSIAEKARDSKLFKAGFVVNTVGAVGDFVVLSSGVMKELPPSAWGVLSLTLVDLSLTVAVRKGILSSIKSNSEAPE